MKVGILNTVSLGLNVRDNFKHYNTWDASFRTAIDVAGFALSIAFAAWTAPIWVPTMAGFAVGTGASVLVGLGINTLTTKTKDAFFWRKRYR